nr:ABC transporter ATP-binding protein [Atopobium sp. oral taxon 810]
MKDKVEHIMALVGLEGMEDRMTNQLSGGQQQRVALARALVIEPGVLLFDEPLSNLDAKLRVDMRTEIRRIQQEAGITAVYVTHDQSEAMVIADQIIIMKKGVVDQIGGPHEVYNHPVDEFVADFIGESNFLRGKLSEKMGDTGVVETEGFKVPVTAVSHLELGADAALVLRPEALTLADHGLLKSEIVLSRFMGAYQNYHVRIGQTLVKLAVYNPRNKKIYNVDDTAYVDFNPEDVHVL